MRRAPVSAAALLCIFAGQAVGQTIDGKITASPDETAMYTLNWIQNQTTRFGDNLPQTGMGEDNSDAPNVGTGIEIRIPLTAFGGVGINGNIRIAGFINSGDHGFASNQIIGGLGGPSGNLGDARNVTLDDTDQNGKQGAQFVIVPSTVQPTGATIDGMRDVVYGASLFDQDTGTGFGDNTDPAVDTAGGSEIDNVHAFVTATDLYIFIGGNLETNFNKLELFFDVDDAAATPAGQSRLRGDNPDVDFNGLNRMGDDGSGNGLVFDNGFTADYYLTCTNGDTGDGTISTFANYAELLTNGGGQGEFVGQGNTTNGVVLLSTTGGIGDDIEIAFNNSNIGGVGPSGFVPDIPDRDVALGSEIDNVYTFLDDTGTNTLYMLVSGNFQSNDNKLVLFFDVDANDGQNTLRSDNVDIDFRVLTRMGENLDPGPNGTDPVGPGLTFDTGFAPDYVMTFKNSGEGPGTNVMFANAATLRANGPLFAGPFVIDYGSYDGGAKSDPANDPVTFDGTDFATDAPSTANDLFTNFGPRLAQVNFPADPPAGLIQMTLDNSNVGGVTAFDDASPSVADAGNVTTGIEVAVNLDELGWDGTTEIRIAGFILSSDGGFVSNQVIGGLPDGAGGAAADNLGEPRTLDFSTIAGDQFISVNDTPGTSRLCADQNNNGTVEPADFSAWIANFNANDLLADVNQNGSVEPSDFSAWIAAFNQGAGGPTCTP
ncbi:MAG TPA: hypothetical protein ENJ00_05570 [Phycisphaerales bacterium]|nr:hypothetical protein [Phycisphaerales bacterium]